MFILQYFFTISCQYIYVLYTIFLRYFPPHTRRKSKQRFVSVCFFCDNSRVLDWVGWESGVDWDALAEMQDFGEAWRSLYFWIHVYVVIFCIHVRLWFMYETYLCSKYHVVLLIPRSMYSYYLWYVMLFPFRYSCLIYAIYHGSGYVWFEYYIFSLRCELLSLYLCTFIYAYD